MNSPVWWVRKEIRMSRAESAKRELLESRLRKMLATVVDPGDLLEASMSIAGNMPSAERVIDHVIDEIGVEAVDWQSHEFVEPLKEACRASGFSNWADEFEDLVCYSGDQLVPGLLLAEMTRHLTDFQHPRQLESFFSKSFLSQNWPLHDGLHPVEPFRFLSRHVCLRSLFEKRDNVDVIAAELMRELDWVSGEMTVAGVLDGPLEISHEEAWMRWVRLTERIRGFLDGMLPSPRLRWECSPVVDPRPGHLYGDPGQEEWFADFLHRCCRKPGSPELVLRLPEEIPISLRPVIARALRGGSPPELISTETRSPLIVAGKLPADPEVLLVLDQRTRSFDLVLELGGDPPWRQDWLDMRAAGEPVWWAREQDFPRSSEEYIHRNFHELESLPVIALESMIVDRGKRDLKRLLDRISRRRGGGWERLGELLQLQAASPRILQPSGDRTL